jgi:hypothetical protein
MRHRNHVLAHALRLTHRKISNIKRENPKDKKQTKKQANKIPPR